MKRLLIVFVLLAGIAGLSSFVLIEPGTVTTVQDKKEDTQIKWLTIEEAHKLNKKNPKKVFVDVYTDWCGWCKKMDKSTFVDPEVVEYANKHFYAVKLNAESAREFEMDGSKMTEYSVARAFKVGSYPTIVFIDKDFKTIYPMPGYRDANGFLQVLKQMKDADLSGGTPK